MPSLTADDVRRLLLERIDALGSLRAVARECRVSETYLRNVLSGKSPVGKKLLAALKLTAKTVYHEEGR